MEYFVQYTVFVLILSALMGLSTWKLFRKMGHHPLLAFVPFYNYFLILKVSKKPKWWALLAYMPIVGSIMMTVFHLLLMDKFGKKLFPQKFLTVVLPFIYMAYINYFDDAEIDEMEDLFLTEEERQEKKKDTLIGSLTFAAVFATIIHTFVTQPFGIPTGSMERTLLVGDFLFVNKWSYGFRMPTRPLAIPFLQSTIMDTGEKGNPKDDPKSYVDAVELPYLRIFSSEPQRNDIVVFNYPDDSVHTAIDRKDPYVKRLLATAGDVLEIKAGKVFINGKPEKRMADAEVQHSYTVTTEQLLDIDAIFKAYGVLPFEEKDGVYVFSGLTDAMVKDFKAMPGVTSVEENIDPKGEKTVGYYINKVKSMEEGETVLSNKINYSNTIFPHNKNWNPDWYGPLRIPKKGDVISLTEDNLPEYQKLITQYEGNTLVHKDGKFFINGKETDQYTVKYNYYMMIGDNRDNSLDARFFGFVPETHIMGKPMFAWLSLQGLFSDSERGVSYSEGKIYQAPFKIRWERMFKAVNTGDANKTSYWWLAVLILTLFFGWDYIMKIFKKKKEDE